jgi:RNA polymerase sigma-70 factor (ECF subfamily)
VQRSYEHSEPQGSDPARLDVERVYREYVGNIFGVLQRFGVGRDEVEDATQEVFIIAHRRLPDFDLRFRSVSRRHREDCSSSTA